MKDCYLAIDIGASSGRHIIGYVQNGRMELKEIYRFENRLLKRNGHLVWDTKALFKEILTGLKACKEAGMIPQTVGIDTWGVDFVLLDENDRLIGDAVAYRDSRTEGIDKSLSRVVSEHGLYEKTGIQKQPFNTIYQLLSLQKEDPGQLKKAASFLMIPDYFNFLLTGIKKQEYTNATTTNLVNAAKKEWDMELIARLGFPAHLFKPLSVPGETAGEFTEDVAKEVGFSATVILPATHDTGSAFLAVPAQDEASVYLSSGTWSLLGVETLKPQTSEEAFSLNFTNEGGAFYRYRFLKNIMGLWIIQSVRRELNGTAYVEGTKSRHVAKKEYSFAELSEAAEKCYYFTSKIDVNDERFLSPESMIDEIKGYCREHEAQVPETVGELMQCVYTSLADCYVKTIADLSKITRKKITGINIIGGGSQDSYLNRITAKASGLPVYAGPTEGTAIGNLVIQMIHAGIFKDLQDARDCIFKSFDIEIFT